MTELAGLGTETCDMVIETLREVFAQELPEERQLELDEKHEFPEALVRQLLSEDVGLQLVFLPEEYGGLGGGARDVCRISEAMARVDLGVATAFLAIFLGTDPILVAGTEEQKQRWLTRIAEEGLIVAYGVTEPAAGSNIGALTTTATPITDGDGTVIEYRLDGVKQFITNGSVADLYTIMAKTDAGPSFFVVEKGAAGLSFGKREDKHGIRASDTCAVFLDGVVVPADHLLGGVEGEGLHQASAVFGYTRLMVGAFGLGGGQAALDRAILYARTRVQSGTSLLEKEGYVFKLLVPHWIDLAAGRAYVREIGRRIDGGEKDLHTEGSVAKLWATEAGNRAADAAIQALGGYGYAREYMVEKHRRDVRITSIYEGTSEIQQSIVGTYRWKDTVRSKGELYGGAARDQDAIHTACDEVGAEIVAACFRGLDAVIRHAHARKTMRHQTAMFLLADLACRSEVAGAYARRSAELIAEGAPDAQLHAAASRVFARTTFDELRAGAVRLSTGFLAADDDEEFALADALFDEIHASLDARRLAGSWRDMETIAAAMRDERI